MEHITITELRKEIERKREEPLNDEQFKTLLIGFADYAMRQHLYSVVAVFKARKRGWMSVQMAHFFKQYATQ